MVTALLIPGHSLFFVVAQCKPREDRVRGCLHLCSLPRPTVSDHGNTQEVSVPALLPRAKKHVHSLSLNLWANKPMCCLTLKCS